MALQNKLTSISQEDLIRIICRGNAKRTDEINKKFIANPGLLPLLSRKAKKTGIAIGREVDGASPSLFESCSAGYPVFIPRFGFGFSNTGSSGSGSSSGGSSGKHSPGSSGIQKENDQSSPVIYQACIPSSNVYFAWAELRKFCLNL